MIPVAFSIFISNFFLDEKKHSEAIQSIFQIWMGIYMPMIFSPVTHRGRDNFKKGKNYVVTINHNSLADVPVSSPGIPGPNRTLAKSELSRIPIFGYIYRSGSILLSRESAKSRKESLSKMIQVLEKGMHLCLFPEGTRNKTDEPLARFFDGAFRVAIETKKPIMPGLIFGTKYILHPKKKYWAWPHKVEFHFLPEVSTESYTIQDTDALKNRVWAMMKDYYVNHSELI